MVIKDNMVQCEICFGFYPDKVVSIVNNEVVCGCCEHRIAEAYQSYAKECYYDNYSS